MLTLKFSHQVILYVSAGLLGGYVLNEVIPSSEDKRLGTVIIPDSCCVEEVPINPGTPELTPEKLQTYFKEKEDAYIKEMESINLNSKLNRLQYDMNIHKLEESYYYKQNK